MRPQALGGMSRWLEEAERGPQGLVGALGTKEESVCCSTWLRVSNLGALRLPEPERKKDARSIHKGKPGYQEEGLFETQRCRTGGGTAFRLQKGVEVF